MLPIVRNLLVASFVCSRGQIVSTFLIRSQVLAKKNPKLFQTKNVGWRSRSILHASNAFFSWDSNFFTYRDPSTMLIRELKNELENYGVCTNGFFAKKEMIKAVRGIRALRRSWLHLQKSQSDYIPHLRSVLVEPDHQDHGEEIPFYFARRKANNHKQAYSNASQRQAVEQHFYREEPPSIQQDYSVLTKDECEKYWKRFDRIKEPQESPKLIENDNSIHAGGPYPPQLDKNRYMDQFRPLQIEYSVKSQSNPTKKYSHNHGGNYQSFGDYGQPFNHGYSSDFPNIDYFWSNKDRQDFFTEQEQKQKFESESTESRFQFYRSQNYGYEEEQGIHYEKQQTKSYRSKSTRNSYYESDWMSQKKCENKSNFHDTNSAVKSNLSPEMGLQLEIENCLNMSLTDLITELHWFGVNTDSFTNKSELIQALAEARLRGVEDVVEECVAAEVEVFADNSGPEGWYGWYCKHA